jgi:hypothetical protein
MIDEIGGRCDRPLAGRLSTVAARLTRSLACLILVISQAGVLLGDAWSTTGEAQPSAVQESAELEIGVSGQQPRRVTTAATALPVDDVDAPDVAAEPLVRREHALGFHPTTHRLLQPLRGPPGALS